MVAAFADAKTSAGAPDLGCVASDEVPADDDPRAASASAATEGTVGGR